MSATPKYYDGVKYGKIHSFDWNEAVKKKYICGFNFHLPEDDIINSETTIIKINKKFYRPAEVDFLLGDYSKIKKVLGWRPKISFNKLVKMMIDEDLKKN